ncbi:Gfo/Idh/MocA family oxidoreductase [Paenibacillus sp. HB172176]|uniref:Gfo/Idh/MocA family protein n=1 Tax=Paenibacillus sp. HB172176 TaxID=2493690 RepID=UPI0014394129|nr:Gfo/Idh/MocA family oxidoreductase [Paenibacillus sp. HB172176]
MKKFRIGMVGAGAVTRMHLLGYAGHGDRIEIVAICDPSETNVNERGDEFGIPGRYTDVGAMIEQADFDVAVVCTPSTIRRSVVMPLLQAGIPVFVEKPFADTLEEAKALANEAERMGIPVAVNQNFRKHHKFDYIRELVKDGVIGKLEGIGFDSLFYRQDAGWRLQTDRHALSVMAIHWFDGIRRIADAEAKSVYCTRYSSQAINCVGETDATVQILFDNGVRAHFSQSFSSPFVKNELIVMGSAGVISSSSDDIHLYRLDPSGIPTWHPTPVQTWRSIMPIEEAVYDGLNQLLTWIETGAEAANSARDNLHTVALLDAAYISASDNEVVKLHNGLLNVQA